MTEVNALPLADLARLVLAQATDPASGFPSDMAPAEALELIASALDIVNPDSEREERAARDLAKGFRAWSEALAEDAAMSAAKDDASAALAAQGVLVDPTLNAKPLAPDADPGEKEYFVQWEIELYASSPRAAAEKALAIQRDPESISTHFRIADNVLGWIDVDLADEEGHG